MEYLQKIERDVQAKWEKERVYEFDAPAEPRKSNDEKFMVTFPYPYMNGRLHLGHTFSLSKAEVSMHDDKRIAVLYIDPWFPMY